MKNKKDIIIISASLVLIVASFFIGRSFSRTSVANNFPGADRGQFMQNGSKTRGQFANGNARGIVDSITDSNLVIKNQDGSSKIVLISASTTISKSVIATSKDVVSGESVMVRGKSNSDGSITADSIQIFNGQDFSFQGNGGRQVNQ